MFRESCTHCGIVASRDGA